VFLVMFMVAVFLVSLADVYDVWYLVAVTDTVADLFMAYFACILLVAYLDRRRVEMLAQVAAQAAVV
jgi:hypothetical protein